jgi:LysR family transcriptional regulator, glycine cleavage system transcriptional activator
MRRRLPPLNALRAFEAAARHESFARAAAELHITRTAVSHQVRHLENHLGTPLFKRGHRNVQLTESGVAYLLTLKTAFDLIDSGSQRLVERNRGNRLVVNVDQDFATLWLVHAIGRFYARHRDISIEIVATASFAPISEEAFDCAIHFGRGDWTGVTRERLATWSDFPVCSPVLRGRVREPADLCHWPLLHDRSTEPWRHWLAAVGADGVVDWSAGPIFNGTTLCLEAAMAGHGVTIGDDLLASRFLESGLLIAPFNVGVTGPDAYYLLIAEAAAKKPQVQAFRHWLLQEMRRRRRSNKARSATAPEVKEAVRRRSL